MFRAGALRFARSPYPAGVDVRTRGYARPMADDDDDWVGTPPEGRYTRDRAKPEFWWRQKPIVPAFVGIFVVVVVILIVVLLG